MSKPEGGLNSKFKKIPRVSKRGSDKSSKPLSANDRVMSAKEQILEHLEIIPATESDEQKQN